MTPEALVPLSFVLIYVILKLLLLTGVQAKLSLDGSSGNRVRLHLAPGPLCFGMGKSKTCIDVLCIDVTSGTIVPGEGLSQIHGKGAVRITEDSYTGRYKLTYFDLVLLESARKDALKAPGQAIATMLGVPFHGRASTVMDRR